MTRRMEWRWLHKTNNGTKQQMVSIHMQRKDSRSLVCASPLFVVDRDYWLCKNLCSLLISLMTCQPWSVGENNQNFRVFSRPNLIDHNVFFCCFPVKIFCEVCSWALFPCNEPTSNYYWNKSRITLHLEAAFQGVILWSHDQPCRWFLTHWRKIPNSTFQQWLLLIIFIWY